MRRVHANPLTSLRSTRPASASARRWLSGLALAALASAAGTSAEAARVARTDFDGLVRGAAMIVEGRVESVDPDAGTLEPRTRVTLRVDRLFDGHHPGSLLTFDLPMGLMPDGTVLDIAEAPRFAPGETYLVFYKRGDWNITPVVGWDQGYFRAVDAGGRTVYASAGGHCVTGLGTMGFTLGRRVAAPASMPGFGAPVPVAAAPSGAPDDACLDVEAVRATLARRLIDTPVEPTDAWRTAPAAGILRRALKPHAPLVDAPRPMDALDPCGPWTSCPTGTAP